MSVQNARTEARIGFVLLSVGIAAAAASSMIDVTADGAAIFPLIASAMLTIIGAIQLILSWKNINPENSVKSQFSINKTIYIVIATGAYIYSAYLLGYLIPTAIFGTLFLYLFGIRSIVALVAGFFAFPAILYGIFFWALGVYPIRGQWFDLVHLMRGW